MTVKELTKDFTEGSVVIVDTTTEKEAGTLPAQSALLEVIGDKDVVEWKAVGSSTKYPKIKVYCELTEPAPEPTPGS